MAADRQINGQPAHDATSSVQPAPQCHTSPLLQNHSQQGRQLLQKIPYASHTLDRQWSPSGRVGRGPRLIGKAGTSQTMGGPGNRQPASERAGGYAVRTVAGECTRRRAERGG
jgi:hypothetical protein